jgi:tight adherence protein B
VRRQSAGAFIGLVVASVALSTAGPADAAVRGRIVSVQAKSGTLNVVFGAVGLGDNETIDPSSVHLALNGTPLTAKVAANNGQANVAVTRRVVLAIDTSGSMTGARIAAARQAATAYLARVPADVAVGLVTFSSTARVVFRPTTNRAPVRTAVQRLQATGNTALYDAVGLAVSVLGTTGDRSILLLSDGVDDGSHRTLAQDATSLRQAKIALNAVLLGPTAAGQALTTLSNVAGGRVVSARAAADLTKTFEQAARESDKDLVISAVIPAAFTGGEATVTVSATAAGQRVDDTAIVLDAVSSAAAALDPALFGPKPVKPISGVLRHKTLMWSGLVAVFLGLGALLAFAFNGVASRPASMRGRLRPFVDSARTGGRGAEPEHARGLRETAVGLADELVKTRGLEESLARKLDAGGIPLKPAEWLMLHIGIALVLPLLVLLLTNVNIGLTVIAVALGILGPFGYLTVKGTLRTRAFLAQLPDTLQLLSGSLSAGYSLPQGLDAVVRQGSPPISDELHKALVEARLGAPIEDALEDVAERMASKDFSWVVMAIRVQRQVGGNLAEVLATTAATLRERERLRRQVQVLSAEGRLSAYILFGLPVTFALYMIAVRPGYIKPLVTDPIGIIMLIGMGILLTVGGFWLRKVVTVEV